MPKPNRKPETEPGPPEDAQPDECDLCGSPIPDGGEFFRITIIVDESMSVKGGEDCDVEGQNDLAACRDCDTFFTVWMQRLVVEHDEEDLDDDDQEHDDDAPDSRPPPVTKRAG